MQVTFNSRISKIEVAMRLIMPLLFLAFGIAMLRLLIISPNVDPITIEFFILISLIITILCIVPISLIINTIVYYLFERKLTIIIDESTQQIQYITPTSKTVLSLQHVAYWDVYFNDRMCSLEFNVLEFDNGQIIMFSSMFPLKQYLEEHQKEYGLPEKDTIGTMFKYYKYFKFIREQETNNSQTQE